MDHQFFYPPKVRRDFLKARTFKVTTDTDIFTLDNHIAPEGVLFLRFFVPADMDTRYGFYCFAAWR